jgi:hypothetical protein
VTDPKTPQKRTGAELWKALQEAEAQDDMNEVLAMSEAELDADIRANGGDPDAIGNAGAALVKELLERRQRLAWHGEMDDKVADFQAVAAASRTTEKLPRPELLRRLAAARTDPRFATPVAALFQKKTPEASTDEELQALLEQIELLAKIDET